MTPETEQTVLSALMEIKGSLGSLNSSINQFAQTQQDHSLRIANLESYQDRQKGAIAVWVAVATAIGTGIGYFIEWLVYGRHH